jgi:hypothetical protein
MMPCPHCEQAQHSADEIWFDLCEYCGLARLDFGNRRPRLYVQWEQQLLRWQAGARP